MFNSVSNAMVEKSADAAWQRMQVITHNIANEDTPGYKAKRLEFESLLRKEIGARTNVTALNSHGTIAEINGVRPRVYQDTGTVGRADGNNVDIDSENMEFAKVQIQYDAIIKKISGHYSTLKYVITGR